MDIDQILQYLQIPQFYYALHNSQHPDRVAMQTYIRKNQLKQFFPVAVEHKPQKFKFILLKNMEQYVHLFNSLDNRDRNLYAMYLYAPRYLYLDIDCIVQSYISREELKKQATSLINWLCDVLNSNKGKFKFENKHAKCSQCVVFDSSRLTQSGEFKISMHVFNPFIIWQDIDEMINDIKQLKRIAQMSQTYCRLAAAIDVMVYKKLQLFRMPKCTKKNDKYSMKRILLGVSTNMDLVKLIRMHQVDIINGRSHTWKPYINITNNVKSKLNILKAIENKCSNKVNCTEVTFTNNKCIFCTSSNNNITEYLFKSSINSLEWMEYRCVNQECNEKRYQSINSNLKYPRLFSNVAFAIDELEDIDAALKIFQVNIKDHYKYVFDDSEIIEKQFQTELKITKNVLAACGHKPRCFIIKNNQHQYLKTDGKYTIQCNEFLEIGTDSLI